MGECVLRTSAVYSLFFTMTMGLVMSSCDDSPPKENKQELAQEAQEAQGTQAAQGAIQQKEEEEQKEEKESKEKKEEDKKAGEGAAKSSLFSKKK